MEESITHIERLYSLHAKLFFRIFCHLLLVFFIIIIVENFCRIAINFKRFGSRSVPTIFRFYLGLNCLQRLSSDNTSRQKISHKRIHLSEISELNLRVFLGEEYECPRGHRFFCSGPEKIIKVSSTSTVKVNNSCKTIQCSYYWYHKGK